MRDPISLAERLGWAEVVAPGTVLMTDGSFLVGWRYRGPDAITLGEGERTLQLSQVNDALLSCSSGWMFHFDRIRRPSTGYAPEAAFPDPATQRLDDLRRAAHLGSRVHYETDHVVCATYLPPPESHSRWAAWFISGGERRTADWRRVWREYEAKLRELEDRLSAAVSLERLGSDALLSHLYECLTGRRQQIRTSSVCAEVGDLLAAEMLGGFEPRVGAPGFEDRGVLPIAVSGFPASPEAGVLDALDRLPFAFRFSSRWIPLSHEAAARRIGLRRKLWMLKRRGLLGPDGHAVSMVEDAEAALAELSSGEVRFGHYTPVVLVMEPEAATARMHADEVLRLLREHGFVADVETVNAPESFLGTLPGHGGYNVRRSLVSTRSLTHLLPLTAVWPGEAKCPSPLFPAGSPALLWARTEGATPFRLNLHVSDVGHALVLGPTGSGKSLLLNLLAASWRRYARARTAIFDVDDSALPLAQASGARHYALAAGRPDAVRLQPLSRIDEPGERAWAADWLEVLFGLQGVPVTPAHREHITTALTLVAANPPAHRTLTALLVQLQDPALQTALRPYTLDGGLAHLLDAADSDLGEADHEVFELRSLMGLGERVLVPVLLCLLRHVERRMDGTGPGLIVVDEAWLALEHSLFGGRIADWLRTLRKKNVAVVLATQSLSDLAESPLRSILLESCPSRIYLPNREALREDGRALYRRFGLSDREAEIVGSARPKRDYYYRSPLGSRLFELDLSPEELQILTHHSGGSHAAPIARVG